MTEEGIKDALPQSTQDAEFYDIGIKEPYAINLIIILHLNNLFCFCLCKFKFCIKWSRNQIRQVEIIGWMYQYYNTEPKNEAFALLKKNVKITKERIPAATQLFTPDWIVRYMVENTTILFAASL